MFEGRAVGAGAARDSRARLLTCLPSSPSCLFCCREGCCGPVGETPALPACFAMYRSSWQPRGMHVPALQSSLQLQPLAAALPFNAADKGVMMHPIMGALRHTYGGPWEVRHAMPSIPVGGMRRAASAGTCCPLVVWPTCAVLLCLVPLCPARSGMNMCLAHSLFTSCPRDVRLLTTDQTHHIPPHPLARYFAVWSWARARRNTS